MIRVTPETTPEDILEYLEAGGCTVKDLIAMAERLEQWEGKYPSSYPRFHFDQAARRKQAEARIIRKAISFPSLAKRWVRSLLLD